MLATILFRVFWPSVSSLKLKDQNEKKKKPELYLQILMGVKISFSHKERNTD
jgi:hypothetical protein